MTIENPAKAATMNHALFFWGKRRAQGSSATAEDQETALREFLDLCLEHIAESRQTKKTIGFTTQMVFEHKHTIRYADGIPNVFRDRESPPPGHSAATFNVHLADESGEGRVLFVYYGNQAEFKGFGFHVGGKPGVSVDFTDACIESAARLISEEYARKKVDVFRPANRS